MTVADLTSNEVRIPLGGRVSLNADVVAPPGTKGIVLFAHGSGSSRHSLFPGATHLYEERAALEAVATAAGAWFREHLCHTGEAA